MERIYKIVNKEWKVRTTHAPRQRYRINNLGRLRRNSVKQTGIEKRMALETYVYLEGVVHQQQEGIYVVWLLVFRMKTISY